MTASATHATVAGVPSKRNLGGPFACATSIEDKECGERTPRVLFKSPFLGVASTDKEARERPISDGIDLKVVSTRQGLKNKSRTMAQATMDEDGATNSSIIDSSNTDSASSALRNGVSGASPTLMRAEDCGFPVSTGRLLKSSDPEVTCPEERGPSFGGTSSATPSPRRIDKKPRKKRKRMRRTSSHEPGGGALEAVKLGVPLAIEKSSSFEKGALQEMSIHDDSGALSRHGAA